VVSSAVSQKDLTHHIVMWPHMAVGYLFVSHISCLVVLFDVDELKPPGKYGVREAAVRC